MSVLQESRSGREPVIDAGRSGADGREPLAQPSIAPTGYHPYSPEAVLAAIAVLASGVLVIGVMAIAVLALGLPKLTRGGR